MTNCVSTYTTRKPVLGIIIIIFFMRDQRMRSRNCKTGPSIGQSEHRICFLGLRNQSPTRCESKCVFIERGESLLKHLTLSALEIRRLWLRKLRGLDTHSKYSMIFVFSSILDNKTDNSSNESLT